MMNEREKLKNTLTHYSEISPNLPGDSKFQQDCVQRFESLLTSERSGYRDHLPGHFTGAALIVDPTGERVLLTHHRKLKKWLQLGGHADGDWDLSRVALKEGQEESGLNKLSFIPFESLWQDSHPIPFDLDIHEIPATPKESAHQHYDARFLFMAHEPEKLICSEESKEIRWVPISEVSQLNQEESMLRQIHKLQYILKCMKETSSWRKHWAGSQPFLPQVSA